MFVLLTGCATAIGTPNEAKLVKVTSLTYGADASQVKVSDIETDKQFGSGTTYYNAEVKGRKYRCMVDHAFGSLFNPSCAKPGEPLKPNDPSSGYR